MNHAGLSREGTVLLLAAAEPSDARDAALRLTLREGVDLPRLIALAELERALPVLAWRIRDAAPDALDAPSATTLRHHGQVAEFRMMQLQRRLGETLDSLAAAQVRVMLLKGAAVAATTSGTFAERPMGDLDLLIEHASASRALEAALQTGWKREADTDDDDIYSRHHHLPPLIDATGAGVALELHTELFVPGHPFGLTAEHVWRRSVERELDGRTVRVPHPADQIVHACVHFAWAHTLSGGAWRTFRDVGVLLERGSVSWSELVELAVATRASTCAYWTLRLARATTGLSVPGKVLSELQPGLPGPMLHWIERHLLTQLLPSEPGSPSVRIQQGMWNLAIRPRRSGHGAARPWARADDWQDFAERRGALPTKRAELSDWLRYVRRLVAPSGDAVR